jgi:hypothetical protein
VACRGAAAPDFCRDLSDFLAAEEIGHKAELKKTTPGPCTAASDCRQTEVALHLQKKSRLRPYFPL